MEQLFCSDERGYDMHKWATNIQALGEVISNLAYCEDKTVLESCGEALGDIICDYANALLSSIDEASVMLTTYFNKGEVPENTFLDTIQERIGAIKQGAFTDDGTKKQIKELISSIKNHLNELHVTMIMGVESELEDILSVFMADFLSQHEQHRHHNQSHMMMPGLPFS
ncbi:MAG: hypothetical protein PVG39_31875, partial [Desulfobacteraceae bacterium]